MWSAADSATCRIHWDILYNTFQSILQQKKSSRPTSLFLILVEYGKYLNIYESDATAVFKKICTIFYYYLRLFFIRFKVAIDVIFLGLTLR